MPLVFAAIMPHGDCLLPDLGVENQGAKRLRRAMRAVARSAAEARLDALVLATPHGIAVDGAHAFGTSTNVSGSLGPYGLQAPADPELALEIIAATLRRRVMATGVGFGGDYLPLPLDWGSLIPMWFLAKAKALPRVVVMCPERELGLESLAQLGEGIAEVAQHKRKRIGIVVSADQAHAHDESGPYGFNPAAAEFDELIVRLTEEGEYEEFLRIRPELIESALPDSLWQMAILTGAFRKTRFAPASVTYACPTYFGMMVAEFRRKT